MPTPSLAAQPRNSSQQGSSHRSTSTAVITGASGFIGRALTDELSDHGWSVSGLDRSADEPGIAAADIAIEGPWQESLAGADVVIHAAALVGMPTPRDPDGYWRVNTLGTRRVLEAAARAGVGRVVLLSSVVVYGFDFPDGVDETHPVRPTGVPYVDTKIAAEQVALAAHASGEVEVTVVRPGDVYGPGSIWINEPIAMMRARTFALPARGRGIFSPVHVSDLVAGILAAATVPAAAGQVLNLSGGIGVPAGEFFDRVSGLIGGGPVRRLPTSVLLGVAAAAGTYARIRRTAVNLSPDAIAYLGERKSTYAIERAASVLGWHPQIGLDEGMAQVAESLRLA